MKRFFFFIIAVTSISLFSALPIHADSQANKELVLNFYRQALIEKDVEAAAMAYLTEGYIQHNPYVATGRQGFVEGLTGWFSSVDVEFSIVRAIADGDLVALHVKQIADGKTRAVMDIFRVEDGKIAEHWDVSQEVPKEMAHDNGMF